ncbi:MAG TPA: extracellular solute-binding protein [Propionibacteriaceae bacterium]|jgi:raffinose/stachyose/melibiose transport system substrate-binding protein
MSGFSRRGFIGLGAGAATVALAGCTGAGSTAPTAAPSSAAASVDGKGKTLRLFSYEATGALTLLQGVAAKFDAQYGCTTTIDNLPGSGAAVYPDKLRTELLGGKGPDVWRIWGGSIGAPYAKAKQALDLSPYYAKYGWDSKISKAAVAGMTFNGVKSGVPYIIRGVGGWYNKSLFTKAGITAPAKSYAELEANNDKLVAAGITPLGTGGKFGWHIMRLFEYLLEHSAGPDLHDKLLVGSSSWDCPEVVAAFTLFKKWQDKKWVPEGALGLDPADIEPAYVQGKTAYTIAGAWTEPQAIQAAKVDEAGFGVFAFPTDKTPMRHSGWVEGLMINAKSPNPDLAAAFVDFFVSVPEQKELQITSSTVIGAEPDTTAYPLSVEWAKGPGQDPFYTIQDQAFPKLQADGYFAIQSEVLQGISTPQVAAKKMQDVIKSWVQS